MEFFVDAKKMAQAMSVVWGCINESSDNLSSSFCFSADDDAHILISVFGEMKAEVRLECEFDSDDVIRGYIIVDAKILFQLMKKLTGRLCFNIMPDNRVVITRMNMSYKFGWSSRDIEPITDAGIRYEFNIPTNVLVAGFGRSFQCSASCSDYLQAFECILLDFIKDKLIFVGSNLKCLIRHEIDNPSNFEDGSIMIDRNFVSVLLAQLSTDSHNVKCIITNSLFIYEDTNVKLAIPLSVYKFPDYHSIVINDDDVSTMRFYKDDISMGVRIASIFKSSISSSDVIFRVVDGQVYISNTNDAKGGSDFRTNVIECRCKHKDFDIIFDVDSITKVISLCESDIITLIYQESNHLTLWTNEDVENELIFIQTKTEV